MLANLSQKRKIIYGFLPLFMGKECDFLKKRDQKEPVADKTGSGSEKGKKDLNLMARQDETGWLSFTFSQETDEKKRLVFSLLSFPLQ